MLDNVELFLDDAKAKNMERQNSDAFKLPKQNIDAINEQIDRLNYSWQTGKIKTVDKYEKRYEELIAKLEEAKAEQNVVMVKDFSKIDGILCPGWKVMYKALDNEHKRAFWRSFIDSIDVEWGLTEKKLNNVDFF